MYRKLLLLSLVFVMGVAFLPMSSPSVQAQDGESDGEWEVVVYDADLQQIATINQDGEQEKLAELDLPKGAKDLIISPDRKKVAYLIREISRPKIMVVQFLFTNRREEIDCEYYNSSAPAYCDLAMGDFSPNSNQVVYGYSNGTQMGLEVIRFTGTDQHGTVDLEYGIDLSEQGIRPFDIHWEDVGIFFTPSYTNAPATYPHKFEYVWTGNREVTQSNHYRAFQSNVVMLSSGETIVPIQNFSYPFMPLAPRLPLGERLNLANVVTYFETATDFKAAYAEETLSTSGTPIYHNSSGIRISEIVNNGDGVVIGTYDDNESWILINRQGDKINLHQFLATFEDIDGETLFPEHDDVQVIGTSTGWLVYNKQSSDLVEFEMSGSEITPVLWRKNANLIILETPELLPVSSEPFTSIAAYEWGDPICNGTLPSRLEIGAKARIYEGFDIPVHFEPREDSLVTVNIGSFTDLLILDGPECIDSNPWWKVSYSYGESGVLVGWLQEMDENYWVEPRGTTVQTIEIALERQARFPESSYLTSIDPFCPGYLNDFALGVGTQGQVLPGDPNNLRAEPFGDADLIGQIPGEGVFEVIDGPRCSGDVLWWKVDYNGTIGWTGEGIRNIYWVESYSPEEDIPTATATACEGFLPSRLTVGGTGKVTPGAANNVRTEARYDAELVGQIPGGASFTVLDGPVCGENSAWWQVEYEGITGWTAEGQGDDYWLEP